MSKIAIKGAETGTGVFTLESPATNTDRTLVLPDEAGTVLTSASGLTAGNLTGSVPASAMPAGSVIQVVQTTTSAAQVFNVGGNDSTTFYDVAGLTLSITPTSSNSKILLVGSINVGQYGNGYTAYLRFTRNGTAIGVSDSLGNNKQAHAAFRSGNDYQNNNIAMSFLDSPASLSPVSYKVQICNTGGSGYPSYINRPHVFTPSWMFGTMSVFTAFEVLA